MGLLDQPLIEEMDAIEKKARQGDEQTLRIFIYEKLPTFKRVYVDRLMHNEGLNLRDALAKAGIVICIR